VVDGAGDTIALSDGLLGLDPVTFTAPASGTYGVGIGGVAGATGEYTPSLGETGSLLSAFDLPGEIA